MQETGTQAEQVNPNPIERAAGKFDAALLADASKAEAVALSWWARARPHFLGALRSWVVLSNAAFAVLAEAFPLIQDAIPSLRGVMPAGQYAHVVALVAVVNIALRFRTREALADK